jgi:hypothetical protein
MQIPPCNFQFNHGDVDPAGQWQLTSSDLGVKIRGGEAIAPALSIRSNRHQG